MYKIYKIYKIYKPEGIKIRTAKALLIGMYLHLVLSMVIIYFIYYFSKESGESEEVIGSLFMLYLLLTVIVFIIGCFSAGLAVKAYRKGRYEKLRKSWQLLKLGSIPYHSITFINNFFLWSVLAVVSPDILLIIVPVPVFFIGSAIIQSGCIGACYIKYLRKQPENDGKPAGIHYVLQFIMLFDIISTCILSNRYQETRD